MPRTAALDRAELAARAAGIDWFHSIELAPGLVTPGRDDTRALPDLRGRTVLDVGAWDGFFAFEAERRGAARVLATDSYAWSGRGWGGKAGFDLAYRAARSLRRLPRYARDWARHRVRPPHHPSQGRAVFHARR